MAKRIQQLDTIPPTVSPQHAVALLERQLRRLQETIITLPEEDPEVDAWLSTTVDILNQAFGQPNGRSHAKTSELAQDYTSVMYVNDMFGSGDNSAYADRANREAYVNNQKRRAALLKAYIEQLQDSVPPSTTVASSGYVLHPEIEKVSRELFRNRHYKQAALEAYIRVIQEVRRVSGVNDDGDSLMNTVFGAEKKIPVIQFNSLQTEAERDEQKGIFFLFKGIVGLRNSKAHSNTLFNDPYRGYEYLALASLLMRLLEIGIMNKLP